jgi:hypothetical protein
MLEQCHVLHLCQKDLAFYVHIYYSLMNKLIHFAMTYIL